jgi:hypothetical protein
MAILTTNFSPLLAHTPNRRIPVAETYFGSSKSQLAHAVSLDTNHANSLVADAVENFCPPCGQRGEEA